MTEPTKHHKNNTRILFCVSLVVAALSVAGTLLATGRVFGSTGTRLDTLEVTQKETRATVEKKFGELEQQRQQVIDRLDVVVLSLSELRGDLREFRAEQRVLHRLSSSNPASPRGNPR
jgi:hypothetical protein